MEQFLNELDAAFASWWPYFITIVVCIFGAIRMYVGGSRCPSGNRIDGKVVVITGGSGGLGLATAMELAKRGGKIILGVRSAEKGQLALKSLRESCPNVTAIIKLIDVADFASIREFVNQIQLEYDKIDILINNAGIIFHPYKRTVDGHELTITTNYFGPFLLTHLLLSLLDKSDNGRVINISATAHLRGKLKLDDLNSANSFMDVEAFAQSKLALTMFTKHMASILKHTKITFTAVNPGVVRNTEHLRYSKLTENCFTKFSIWPWMWLFMKTPQQGCQTIVYAAVETALTNVSGCYLSNCEITKPSDLVNDYVLSEKLYKKTCEIIEIDGEEMVKKVLAINEPTKAETSETTEVDN